MTQNTNDEARPLIPAQVRRYLYPLALAVISLAVAYGVIEGEQAAAWTNLAAAVTGMGVAALGTAYRPTPESHDAPVAS